MGLVFLFYLNFRKLQHGTGIFLKFVKFTISEFQYPSSAPMKVKFGLKKPTVANNFPHWMSAASIAVMATSGERHEGRRAWCCLQVKLCDPCLSALYVP